MPVQTNPNLLVGLETSDDAGVFLLDKDTALVQTVDFFTPIVDDPYNFGAIAAANALSDIYAMGAKPLTALNIMAFPVDTLSFDVLLEILRGGGDKINEAGAALLGGHSISDNEPKYGLAVTGLARPGEIWTNTGAKPQDVLILTKPLGIGIITSALRKKKDREGNLQTDSVVAPVVEEKALGVMKELNAKAAEAGRAVGLHACTDVTGFGLLGHTWEMARGSQVQIELYLSDIPVIEGARDLARAGYIAGGNWVNLEFMMDKVDYFAGMDDIDKHILADPITSGGLLMAVSPENAQKLQDELNRLGVSDARVIGRVREGLPRIKILP